MLPYTAHDKTLILRAVLREEVLKESTLLRGIFQGSNYSGHSFRICILVLDEQGVQHV
jgi:hypothetical protein